MLAVEWPVMSEPFTNEPIAVHDLPRLRDEAFVRVDPRYAWGELAGLAGAAVVVAAIAAVIVWQSEALLWPVIVGGGIVVALAAVAIAVVLEARRVAYQIREHDLSLRSGVIRHRVETIPFSRIQHVGVGRGAIERSLGLATLQVSSAGSDISVPGLSVADAERIRQTVAERAGVDDERHGDDGHDDEHDDGGGTNGWAPPPPPPPFRPSP
jgi:membrane protein YdbS with pleckstrin-like domain